FPYIDALPIGPTPVDGVWWRTYGRGSSANSAMSADSASDRGARSATRCPVGVWDDVVTGTSPSMGLIGVAESWARQAGKSGGPSALMGSGSLSRRRVLSPHHASRDEQGPKPLPQLRPQHRRLSHRPVHPLHSGRTERRLRISQRELAAHAVSAFCR